MAGERYFLEVYIPSKNLEEIKIRRCEDSQQEEHLHITLVRPFSLIESEDNFIETIVEYCSDKSEIKYILEGKDSFDEKIFFIPVKSDRLLKFDSGLEKLLENKVEFDKKLNDTKILHLTIDNNIEPLNRKEMVFSELICIRNKKDGSGKRIWFGYDLKNKRIISREEILERK